LASRFVTSAHMLYSVVASAIDLVMVKVKEESNVMLSSL